SIAANYLPKARVLARSLKKFHPELRFCLLVAEPVRDGAHYDYSDFDEVATLTDLGIPHLESWVFKHSLVELCTAVKGPYLDKLLRRPGCSGVFYFDPDMAVFNRLDPLFEGLERGSVVLTPHQLDAE